MSVPKFQNCLRISETDFVISDIDSSKVEVSITSGAIVVQHFIGVWGKNLKFDSITTARTTHLSNAPNYLKLQIVKKSTEQLHKKLQQQLGANLMMR